MASMEEKLQELLDHHEIRKLLGTYCHGCDRADAAEIASVYGPESWENHGPYQMPGLAFARQVAGDISAAMQMCSHLLGQSSINITQDTAGAETYFIVHMRAVLADGTPVIDQMGGRYVDTLTRAAGSWKFQTRTCVRDWSARFKVEDPMADAGFAQGAMSQVDPSYAVLGRAHSGPVKPVISSPRTA